MARGVNDRCQQCPGFERHLRRSGRVDIEGLSARELGEVVTDHRTSWVRRAEIDTINVYIKTYDYPTWRDRTRGWFRTTRFAPSRAAREWEALTWLRARGFAAPEPLALFERRRRGLLHRAVLVTAAYPGAPLNTLLPPLPRPDRYPILAAVERTIEAVHREGFRDRNLDLRNLLARPREDGEWEIALIDSPRHRIVAPGPAHDRAARADWDRLAASLARAGIT